MFADSRLLPRDGIEVVISCLRLMRRRAEANRAQFHVLLHHRLTNGRQRSSPILDETTWERFIHETGAIDITNDILAGSGADPIGPDRGHWSVEGHRRVASKILVDILQTPLSHGSSQRRVWEQTGS